MFSFDVTFIFALILGVSSQGRNFDASPMNNVERASLFNRFHNSIDNADRFSSVSSSQSDLSDEVQNQLPRISCYRIRANIKNVYPTDNTKYFVCRHEHSYEVYTCPNGGIFDGSEKACVDLCEQKQPCLNQGQCIILPDLKLECVCRRDWTGERCEIPLSTCASNPCGPNAECRMLQTQDYPQDYVCICGKQQSYGRSCQTTVPNPCLTSTQQFHPFAFSRRAYINCDDNRIFFQPCNSLLYWNQEEKRCARSLPDLLRAPFVNFKQQNRHNDDIQLNTIKIIQWQTIGDMQDQPTGSQLGQWQSDRMDDNLLQNLPSIFQRLNPPQWSNQMPDMQTKTTQRFVPQLQPQQKQNQPIVTSTLMETTTASPKIFRLQGFASQKPAEQQSQMKINTNNQNQQTFTSSQAQFPMQQNTQFGSNQQQSQTGPMPSSGFQSATAVNQDLPQGAVVHALQGWKSHRQEPLNQINDQNTLNLMPSFQLKSWKA